MFASMLIKIIEMFSVMYGNSVFSNVLAMGNAIDMSR